MSIPSDKFKDYFSQAAAGYSEYRPTYPDTLFRYLADQVTHHNLAWDCATGNGQAAVALAKHFDNVIATDGSEKQLSQAPHIDNIEFRVATAEDSGLEGATVDLVTVAQALHWFNFEAFTAEAKRVLKPGGILAVWTYNLLECDPAVDTIINTFYDQTVGDYWPFERKHVETGYRDINLPMAARHDMPTFAMEQQWTLARLVGYLYTWSAVAACERAQGRNPLEDILDPLAEVWGDPEAEKRVIWPLSVRIWVN